MEQNLSLYRVFYVTAAIGNISKAAKELYISQPAISKSIRKLEENLSATLFTRNSRGVQLTEEGKLLYEHVKNAFDSLSLGEKQLRKISDLGIGHLRIGVSTTLCKYVLLSYLKPFVAKYPHVQISIECQSTRQTLKLIENGTIDLGLIGKSRPLKNLDFYSLGEIEDTFVATSSYIEHFKLRESFDITDFFQNATIMLLDKENITRQFIDDYLAQNQIQINNILETTTMDLLIEFAKIGLGVACVIKEFVKKELADQQLFEISTGIPIPKRKIGFVYKRNSGISRAAKNFIAHYKNQSKHNSN